MEGRERGGRKSAAPTWERGGRRGLLEGNQRTGAEPPSPQRKRKTRGKGNVFCNLTTLWGGAGGSHEAIRASCDGGGRVGFSLPTDLIWTILRLMRRVGQGRMTEGR